MVDNVIIAGGGIAGLSAAIALRRSGNEKVQILEASSSAEFHNASAGAAAQLTPNGLRALRLLGGDDLMQQVLQSSSVIEHNIMVMPMKEKPFDMLHGLPSSPPSDLPTVMIRWGLLRQILAQQVPEESISLNQKIASHDNSHLVLENHNTISLSSKLLVVADGKASLFRPTPLVSNKRINIKAVVPQTAPLPNAATSTYSLFSSTGLACFLGPAGPGWTYWAISIPVASEEEEQTYFAFDQESLKAQLLSSLSSSSLPAERQVYIGLIQATAASSILVQASSQAALPLRFSSHNQVLVGDAAHAMNASYGQAISFSLEDAATLAHCLKISSPQEALAQYSQLRHSRCLEMQQKSQERTAKQMRGESTDDITRWIHDWDLEMSKVPTEVTGMTVIG